jgi:hypothetical protein
MNKFLTASVFSLSAALATVASAPAHAASLSSVSPTAWPYTVALQPPPVVYYADLMGITFDITSISIKDGGPIVVRVSVKPAVIDLTRSNSAEPWRPRRLMSMRCLD